MKTRFVLFCCLLIIGCSKKEDPIVNVPPNVPAPPVTPVVTELPPTVYVAVSGWINSGQNIAKYWKDSISTYVSDSTKSETLTGMAVSGGDVYLSGYWVGTHWPHAQYWKNGVPVALEVGTAQWGYASGIFISGNDVYVSGYCVTPAPAL